jgi:hypothetical protein
MTVRNQLSAPAYPAHEEHRQAAEYELHEQATGERLQKTPACVDTDKM